MAIEKVGVIGCGLMGGGIAQVCATHGYQVISREVNQQLLDKGLATIKARLARDLERGRLTKEGHASIVGRMTGTTSVADLKDCDLVIEAIVEDLPAKRTLFTELGQICQPDAILASNTSSIPISHMAAASKRAERVLGLHFFNPPTVLKLIEVIPTDSTSRSTLDKALAFCTTIDRVIVQAKDAPGFAVNRLLVPFIFDAIRLIEQGIATSEDIDTACQSGLSHTMGPISTADLVGLDTLVFIGDAMFEELGDPRYKAPTSLRRMVTLGNLGRKSGKGFYDHGK